MRRIRSRGRHGRTNLALDRFAPPLIGATVFIVALGSSSVDRLVALGSPARWAFLLAVAVVAIALAAKRGALRDALREPVYLVAAGLLGLMTLSLAWTVDVPVTLERTASFGTLVVAAAALAWAARGVPRFAERVLLGLLLGAAAVAAAGLFVLLISPDDALQGATTQSGFRYRGVGENPNTISMLAGIATPLGLWAAIEARSALNRGLAVTSLALFYFTIVLSGSRGALLASVAGATVVTVTSAPVLRVRLARTAAVAALLVVAVGIGRLPQPEQVSAPVTTSPGPTSTTPEPTVETPPVVVPPSERPGGALADEAGRPTSLARRGLLDSSGRILAWRMAIAQANKRPALGYGFGTEDAVFVDRIYTFQSRRPENSLIGIYLQLGLAGVALLLAIAAAGLTSAVRAARGELAGRGVALAAAGVVVAGGVMALVQSYVYAAGNIATLTVWTCLFLLTVAAASWSRRSE